MNIVFMSSTKIRKKTPLLILGLYALLLAIFFKHSLDYLDPDLGWHLKFGQEIIEMADVPRVNAVNYTLSGYQWVDHEWLSNLVTYAVYASAGYVALNLFFALLALSAVLLQYRIARNFFFQEKSFALLVFFALQLFGAYASLPSLGVRMQEFTLLFLGVLLFIFYDYQKNPKGRVVWFLPPLLYLWSCLHGGFLLGLGLAFLFPAFKAAEAVLFKFRHFDFLSGRPLSFLEIRRFLFWSLLALASTSFTPYGLKLYSFLASYRNDFYLGRIYEWFHQFRYPFFYPQLIFILIVAAIWLWWALRTFYFNRNKAIIRVSLWDVSLLAIFSVLAIRSRRHFPLLAMFSVPVTASLLADFLNLKSQQWTDRFLKDRVLDRLVVVFLTLVFICSLSLQLVSAKFTLDPWKSFSHGYPYEAAKYLQSHPEYSGRLFNEFNWGGYLIWVYPGRELFIDGRLPQVEYKGHSLLEEFYAVFEPGQAQEKLEEHDIEVVLLSAKKEEILPTWWEKRFFGIKESRAEDIPVTALEDYLGSSPDWFLVYQDEVSKVFVKGE